MDEEREEEDADLEEDSVLQSFDYLVDSRASGIDLEALGEALLDQFGGPEGIASAIHTEYMHADKGSINRGRLLGIAIEFLNKVVAKKQMMDRVESMSDDELMLTMGAVRKFVKDYDESISEQGPEAEDPESDGGDREP